MPGSSNRTRPNRFALIASLGAGLLFAATARPSTIMYTNYSSFLAATTAPLTTLGFEGIVPAGSSSYYGLTGLNVDGVDITTSDYQLWVVSSTYPLSGGLGTGDYVEGSYYNLNQGQGSTTFTFTRATYDFGIDIRAYNQVSQPGGTFGFTLSNGTGFGVSAPDTSDFFGFVSDTPFTSVTITPTGSAYLADGNAEFLHFDNVSVDAQAVASTPEPSTIFLCAGGLLVGIAGKRRGLRRG